MGKLVVFLNLTLDGVMQGPARPDEDTRGGFPYGGWAAPYADPEQGKRVAANMGGSGGLLLGRRTYEDFYAVWPSRTDNPFSEVLNQSRKYVVSRTLKEPLPWMNSTLLAGDVPEAVARLKAESAGDITVLGSGVLVQTLMAHRLIDRYTLLMHPLVLGTGHRLFEDVTRAPLRLVDTRTTAAGVIVATYEPAEPEAVAASGSA